MMLYFLMQYFKKKSAFPDTIFTGYANFSEVTFGEDVDFSETTFEEGTDFSGVIFSGAVKLFYD